MRFDQTTEIMEPKTPYKAFREVAKGENRNPSSIAEATGMDKGNVSSALSTLKKHKIVRSEKEGRKRLYYVDWDNFFSDWKFTVKRKIQGNATDISTEEAEKHLSEFENNPRVKDVFKWHVRNYVRAREDSNLKGMLYEDFLYVLKSGMPRTEDEELNRAISATEEVMDYATSFKPELNYAQNIVELAQTD